jgi:nucleotide-binding universal stress UspA family protein
VNSPFAALEKLPMIFKKLLVPLDFGDCMAPALSFAQRIAAPGAQLALLHVIDEQVLEPFDGLLDITEYRRGIEERLSQLEEQLKGAGFDVKRVVVEGSPREELFRYAEGWKPQVLVVGSHGRTGLRRLLLGSVAEKILRSSEFPVCIVKKPRDDEAAGEAQGSASGSASSEAGAAAAPLRHVCFGTDFEKSCTRARAQFVEILGKTGAQGQVLHVFDASYHYSFTLVPDLVDSSSAVQESVQASRDEARTRLDREVASLRKSGLHVEGQLLEGPAWEEITEFSDSKPCDLLILGSHHYQGIDRMLLGSVAEKTVRLSSKPVLVVPNPRAD